MADDQLREMISAFALGCMDRENFIQFKEYMDAGGNLPKKELGEFQNTIALIPIILDLEKPDAVLKNRVAKRLLSLQDEIKEKIKEKKAKLKEEVEKGNMSQSEADVAFPDFEPTFTTQEIQALKTLDKRKTGGENKPRSTEEEKRRTPIEKRTSDKPKPKTITETKVVYKDSKKALYGWLTAIVLFIALIGMYFFLSSNTSEMEQKISEQNKQLEALQKEIALNKQVISEYKELLQFLKHKNNYIVELNGGENYKSATARLIVSFSSGDGILILDNPPPLAEGEAYQLWMISNGKSISLGTLNKDNDRMYYYIYNIPKLPLNEIELFRITNEPEEGSVIPLGNSLLYGNVATF